jgi:adenylate cyclase
LRTHRGGLILAEQPPERRLVAIMFTDIIGSTAVTAASESAGIQLRDRHRELVRSAVERYHGRFVEAPGDESLSTFESAVDAVQCALAIHEAVAEDPELELHLGIHQSETVFRGNEVFGDGVNIAARICALSDGSAPHISDEVQHAVQNQANLGFDSLGQHDFKNVPRPVPVYRVTGVAQPPRRISLTRRLGIDRPGRRLAAAIVLVALIGFGVWSRYGPAELAPIRSIAVLPLENLSGDPEQEYFADGMTEALIGDLARLGALRVISRTSVMQYKGERKSIPEIARELNVDGIIEGTVMRAGDRIRITARLIDARTDRQLWNDRYDRELSHVLALQADVASAVADQVRLELTPEQRAALKSRPVDPAAYDAFLRGRALIGSWGDVRSWAPGAIEHLERAVALDPGLAEAWAWIANIRMSLGMLGYRQRDRDQYPGARQAAQRALELDEHLGMAHTVLGYILMHYAWDFAAAEREFERAIELSPGDPTVVNGLAWYLQFTGKSEEALALSERLPRIAPYDIYYRADRFKHLRFARQYERALEELVRVREVDPAFSDPVISHLYFGLDRLEEAHRAAVAYYELCGKRCDPQREAALRGWAEGGWEGSNRAVAEFYATVEGFSPTAIALLYSLAGDTDEAFAWLEEGYRRRDPLMSMIKFQPTLDPIRSDPRFDALVRRIGFPES